MLQEKHIYNRLIIKEKKNKEKRQKRATKIIIKIIKKKHFLRKFCTFLPVQFLHCANLVQIECSLYETRA